MPEAKVVVALSEFEANALLSVTSKPESDFASGAESVSDETENEGITAKTRLSNELASSPGSTAASRSIAATRFSKRWPVAALLIDPKRIAAWIPLIGSLLPSGASLVPATAVVAFEAATTPPPAPAVGAIVTVEFALIVNVFCRICVAVRLAALAPLPTTVSPLPLTSPTCWLAPRTTSPPPLAVVALLTMLTELPLVGSDSAETVPASSSVAPLATVAVTLVPMTAAPETALKASVLPLPTLQRAGGVQRGRGVDFQQAVAHRDEVAAAIVGETTSERDRRAGGMEGSAAVVGHQAGEDGWVVGPR